MATEVSKDAKKDEVKDVKVRTSPVDFFRQVRTEAQKVTWPTRKETTITAMAVFAMVIAAMIFFFIVDLALASGVRFLLGLNG